MTKFFEKIPYVEQHGKPVKAGDESYDLVYFRWQISDICQYECSYCTVQNDATVNFKRSIIDLVLKRLERYDGPFQLEMFGGEPTTHPDLIYAVEQLTKMENCVKVEILTNLRRSLDYFHQLDMPGGKVFLTPSYHPEYHKWGYLEKCIALNKDYKHTKLVPYIMLSDNTSFWDLTEEVIQGLEENNIAHETTTLMSTSSYKVQYTDEFYKRFGDKIITNGMYAFQYEFEDGHVERVPQESVVHEELYFFKGYKCKPLMHDIDLVGNFSNTCFPKENLGIFFNKEQLTRQRVCPVECCQCDVMYDYYKEL